MITISPSQADIFTALGTFLLGILPPGTQVVRGQVNRVPEPKVSDYLVMWPLRLPRLATNIDTYTDAVFTGSIAGSTLTITSVEQGALHIGSAILGVDVLDATEVTAFVSGSGGTGTYTLNNSQTIGERTLAAGFGEYLQKAEAVIQIDVHGPTSADNAQKISTLFRDEYATTAFATLNPNVVPLLADDPREMPFQNEQEQIELRWIVEAHLQINQTVTVQGQPFADVLSLGLVNVDVTYPPEEDQ